MATYEIQVKTSDNVRSFQVFYRYIDIDVDICANRGYYMYA